MWRASLPDACLPDAKLPLVVEQRLCLWGWLAGSCGQEQVPMQNPGTSPRSIGTKLGEDGLEILGRPLYTWCGAPQHCRL